MVYLIKEKHLNHMVLLFIIGFICLLLVVGYFFSENPIGFTIKAVIVTGALAFIGFIGFFLYAINL